MERLMEKDNFELTICIAKFMNIIVTRVKTRVFKFSI